MYTDVSLSLRLFCSTSEYFSRQLPLRAWQICFSLVSCLQNSSRSKSILFPLSPLTHTLSPYEQLPWQVLVADVNIGYESIVNTQVSANCAGRLWAQCAFILVTNLQFGCRSCWEHLTCFKLKPSWFCFSTPLTGLLTLFLRHPQVSASVKQ